MPNLQNFLEHSDQADLLHRGLQGLRWKLDACALWKKSIPVAQDLSVMDLELRLPAWILIPNNGKRLSLNGTGKKNLSSPERIGFHSVATVWFSFHWIFWLLRKKGFNMVDNSADSMISSATGIFLSFLHAKVGRERLVYFIVSYHIVLNLYFVKWIGLNLRRTKY